MALLPGSHRFARFLATGGFCFLVNLAVLHTGTEWLGLHYLVSMLVSIAAVTTIGWGINRSWTFRSSQPGRVREFVRYASLALGSMGISLGMMALLVSAMGLHYLVASTVIACGMAVANFVGHDRFTFRKTHQRSRRQGSR